MGWTHAAETGAILKASASEPWAGVCSGRACGWGDQAEAFAALHLKDGGGLGGGNAESEDKWGMC